MSTHFRFIGHREILLVEATTIAFGVLVSPAFGQSVQSEDVTELSVIADVTHDSNVARSDQLGAAVRSLHPTDDHLTTGLNIDLKRSLGRNTLSLNGLIGYDFYRRNTQLNRERLGLEAGAGVRAGPCRINLRARIDRGQSDLSTIYFVNQPGIGAVKNTETVQTYGGDIDCGRYYGVNPILGYDRVSGRNSDPIRKLSNYYRDHWRSGLSLDNPAVGKYLLTLDKSIVTYPNRAGGALAAFSGFRNTAVRLTGERNLGSVLTARAGVAYNWVKPRSAAVQQYTGFSWDLSATVVPVTRLQVTLSTSRAVEPSLGEEALYSLDRTYGAQAHYALTSRTTLNADATFSDRSFRGSTGIFGPRIDRDRLLRVGGGLTMAFSKRLTISGVVGYEKRNANGTIYDYHNTYVGLRSKFVI